MASIFQELSTAALSSPELSWCSKTTFKRDHKNTCSPSINIHLAGLWSFHFDRDADTSTTLWLYTWEDEKVEQVTLRRNCVYVRECPRYLLFPPTWAAVLVSAPFFSPTFDHIFILALLVLGWASVRASWWLTVVLAGNPLCGNDRIISHNTTTSINLYHSHGS